MISAEMIGILNENAESFITKIKGNLDATGTTATGESGKSLRYEINEDGSKIVLTVFGKPYFAVVETGRKPGGGVSRGMIDNITKWAQVRGKEEFIWAIAKKIDKEGSELFRKGGRTDIYTDEKEGFADKVFMEVTENIANEFFRKAIVSFE
jgi:hypothetical protein